MSNKVQLKKSLSNNSSDSSDSTSTNRITSGSAVLPGSGTNGMVYGAQHPPSLKVIQDLLTNTNVSNTNNQTFLKMNNNSNKANNYKEFEKDTFDDWNLNLNDYSDDLSLDNDLVNDNILSISIEESNEMAKRIIKDHSDKQKGVHKPTSTGAGAGTNCPGKAQRQNIIKDNYSHSSSNNMNRRPTNESLVEDVNNKRVFGKIEQQMVNKQTTSQVTSFPSNQRYSPRDSNDIEKFKRILSSNPVNLEELQHICWKGIPKAFRPTCWKLLSDYLPLKVELQEKTIEQKRNTYWELVNEYYSKTYLDAQHDTLRQILNDLPRMNPLMPIFQKKQVQDIFQRILYVWSVRHPASGYVQGINDLVTPFFAVFLTEYVDTNKKNESEIDTLDITNIEEKHLRNLEADCYGCMTKLLDRIQENYVFSQPGIQKKVQGLEELIKRIDENLHKHLKKNNIEFLQFAFRWMNNLLMREVPLQCTIRLWDTYHAEPFGFSDFHLYVCAAFLLRFSKDLLKQKDFQDLMLLLQNLPTRTWNSNDIILLTAEAYKLQVMFANAPKHVTSLNSSSKES